MTARNFIRIRSREGIDDFIGQTNDLHDGYILSVRYTDNGVRRREDGRLECCVGCNELTVRILITSLWDSVVELRFTGVAAWSVSRAGSDICGTAVSLCPDGLLIWTDAPSADEEYLKQSTFVRAAGMEYRFCEDNRKVT